MADDDEGVTLFVLLSVRLISARRLSGSTRDAEPVQPDRRPPRSTGCCAPGGGGRGSIFHLLHAQEGPSG